MMHLTMKCVPYCRISVFTLYLECYESVCSRFMWYATASAFTLYVECYGQCVHAVRGMLWVSVFMSYDRGMLGSNAVGGVLQSRMSIQIAVAFAYTHRVY